MRMTKNRVLVEETGFWDLNTGAANLAPSYEHPELRRHDIRRRGIVRAIGNGTEVKVGDTVYLTIGNAQIFKDGDTVGWIIPEDRLDLVKK